MGILVLFEVEIGRNVVVYNSCVLLQKIYFDNNRRICFPFHGEQRMIYKEVPRLGSYKV